MSISASISTSGYVCLCDWSGPVTVTMVVSLLAELQQPMVLNGPSAVELPMDHSHHGDAPVPRVSTGLPHLATRSTQRESSNRQPRNVDAGKVLIINLHPSSARCILSRSSTFADVLPALWSYCQEIIIACHGEDGFNDHLRRALCGSTSTPISTLARPLLFFELLDEAFNHAEGVFPHDVLELRRERLRSGTRGLRSDHQQSVPHLGKER